MKLGFIGLGKMGDRMVTKLVGEGHDVIVWNRTREKAEDLKEKVGKLEIAGSLEDLIKNLETPRVVWSMLPAGDATEEILAEILKFVEKGDIVIDGGNAKFSDTQQRFENFKDKGIRFLGIGVSGGIIAAREGYPLMAGGDRSAYDEIKSILDSLAKPSGGYEYFGEGGAGHFVKMVHNAIEYGYMQSIGEGFGVLDASEYKIDLKAAADLYRKNTLVSGFMMDRTSEALGADPKMEKIEGVIGKASGETIWAVEEAKKKGLPMEVIERSLEIRNESETDEKIQNSFAAKLVSSLRAVFGGHAVKPSKGRK